MFNTTSSIFNAWTNYFYGKKCGIATLNFCGGVEGVSEEASPTEFVTSKKSVEYHEFLYSLQKDARLDDYKSLNECLNRAISSERISPEFREMIIQFIEHSKESPMFDFITSEHLATDVHKDRPPYKYGSSSDVETPVSELYELHSSDDVIEMYNGQFAPLWFFDLMGIWFRDASLETFKNIISESPLVGITSMMITEKLISKAQSMGSDFILAQEFSRGDNIDDLLRRMGWSIIRNVESTAFLYRTASVVNGFHPIPLLNDNYYNPIRIMSPLEFYDYQSIKFNTTSEDKKTAKKAADEIKIIKKADRRTMFVYVGCLKFANVHWSQPKTTRGVEFQQSYFEYLINEGYIVGGDTNTASSKISMLIDRIGTRLMGEDPTLSTSDKMRTRVGTHGQYLRPEKAGVRVSDPKSHIMVPYFMSLYHKNTEIFSNGPVGTKEWPSDHKGKISTFVGISFD